MLENVESPCNTLQTQHIIAVGRDVNLVQNFFACNKILLCFICVLLADHFLFCCLQTNEGTGLDFIIVSRN